MSWDGALRSAGSTGRPRRRRHRRDATRIQKRRLLAALVAAVPDPVSADRLADVLWPGRPPSANAIQAQMSRLRRDISPAKIRSDDRGYTLAVPQDAIDVRRFEELLARSAAYVDDDPAEARCLLRAAESLVRGRPYDDIADTELGRAESVRLERVTRSALRRRLEIELHSDEHVDAACAELEALVVTEPVDEHWWALLMTAQYRQGRQGEALRTFQTARGVLGEELGLEPGPELRELEQRILAQDPTLRPGPGGLDGHAAPARASADRPHPEPPDVDHRPRRRARRPRSTSSPAPGWSRCSGQAGPARRRSRPSSPRRASTSSVTFVEFAPLTDPDSVIPAIASELGISAGDTPTAAVGLSTLDRVIDAIVGAPHLLVLDNCEHVVDVAAKAVYELLEACPDLVVLATSREALGVPGETVRPLPPLGADAAVRLFVERALRRRARPRRQPISTRRSSPRSARASTGSHWRSSWRRHASGRCTSPSCWPGSTTGSPCSPPVRARWIPGSRRCGPSSTGVTTSSTNANARCSVA